MRIKLVTTLALAALLTGSGTVLAMAQAALAQPAAFTCRAPAPRESGYGSRKLSLEECQQQQQHAVRRHSERGRSAGQQ
jgi:hypothetical protein